MPVLLQKLRSWIGGEDKETGSSLLRNLFSDKRPHPSIPLARQGNVPDGIWLQQGDGGTCKTGGVVIDGTSLAWREFVWGEYAKESRRWHTVRWRFYENGHVCFDAQMSNSNEGLGVGHLQGHRIELREKGGLLLGVWAAGFFVGRGQEPLGFQADILDDHETLKMHFADLAEEQSGFWIYR